MSSRLLSCFFVLVIQQAVVIGRCEAFHHQHQNLAVRPPHQATTTTAARYQNSRNNLVPTAVLSASAASTVKTTASLNHQHHHRHRRRCRPGSALFASTSPSSTAANQKKAVQSQNNNKPYKHALAILAMPYTSIDKIANEAIMETVLPKADKLSIVLKCEGHRTPSVPSLRRYVGEIYSQLWDCCVERENPELPDVVVYPSNLPNSAPEGWITIQKDLDCVCSHDSFIGWTSESAMGSGTEFQKSQGRGRGGLEEHVEALNRDRKQRKLNPVKALHVDHWPAAVHNDASKTGEVIFVDDDEGYEECVLTSDIDDYAFETNGGTETTTGFTDVDELSSLLGGVPSVPPKQVFEYVAVGGTFDGMHFGHRKLLTLAISSVNTYGGKLLVGVTCDEMLRKKKYAEYIPNIMARKKAVEAFLHRLAPGMMNRIKIVSITDSFGPPGTDPKFDSLVLSHETLETGQELNKYRIQHGMKPLALLCTRRTEAHGMCSTTIRKLRAAKAKLNE